MVEILIAVDHTLLRENLVRLLSSNLPEVVCGEAENFSTVMGQLHKKNWNLLILDLNMPERNGLEIIKEVKTVRPEIRSLF